MFRDMKVLSRVPSSRSCLVAITLLSLCRVGEAQDSARVSYLSNPTQSTDVILVAHQDDWQLFMGDVVARRIHAGGQVVFVYLTAGDDGRDSAYWSARERGALESTRVAAIEPTMNSLNAECSVANALGHAIRKCVLGNTESYFLRLPDGRRNGKGFPQHSNQSLRKLRAKRIASITAVDSSGSYASWAELMSAVESLVGRGTADRVVTVHTSDPNIVVNPHDHFDHRMAGLLVADARRKSNWNVVYYAGYALATRAANRSTDQARLKASVFQAYDAVMTRANPRWSAYKEHPAFYSECMVRTYGRAVRWR